MSFSYANPTSGPSAGGIGWFNFGSLTLNPGQSATGLTGTLNDGSVVKFDMALSLVSGSPRTFSAGPVPVGPGANFGTVGYTGILGNASMGEAVIATPGVYAMTINNITVKDPFGNSVPNYTAVFANIESLSIGESWAVNTNGAGWRLLATVGSNPPTLAGLTTANATITGNSNSLAAAYVLTTASPTQMTFTVTNPGGSREVFALGFSVTKVTVQKNVGQRINSADQFVLNIGGTPNTQVTISPQSYIYLFYVFLY